MGDRSGRWKTIAVTAAAVLAVLFSVRFAALRHLPAATDRLASPVEGPSPKAVRLSGAPQTRAFHRLPSTVTLLADGRVLVAGATEEPTSAEVYDPTLGKWAETGPMGLPRDSHTATLLSDGRVLVVGGTADEPGHKTSQGLASAEIYDPRTGSWSAAAPLHGPRWDHVAVRLKDGRVLVTGGIERYISSYRDSLAPLRSVEIYDPKRDVWTAGPPMTGPFRTSGLTAIALDDGRVLVVATASRTPDEIYDPSTGTWTTIAIPESLVDASVVWAGLLSNGVVLRIAGDSNSKHDTSGFAATFDPQSNAWTCLTVRGRELVYRDYNDPAFARLPDGRLLASGGGLDPTRDAAIFDARSATWSPARPMSLVRSHHATVSLPSGNVLVIGGLGLEGEDLITSEVYDTESGTWNPR